MEMTIRELAAILGLSKSTVAYALRDLPMVSARTRDFVRLRARELGYIPNPVASAFLHQIRSQGSPGYRGNLAFLTRLHQGNDYLANLQNGARKRAQELGYGLEIIDIGDYGSSRLTRLLQARGVLGVILGPLPRETGHMTLDWSKFASATYGYSMVRPAVHRVVHHHFQGMQTAFRMCHRKGFRRIGLAMRIEADKRSNQQWSSGYWGIQHGLPEAEKVNPLLLSTPHFSAEKICEWIKNERPDVIVFHDSNCVAKLCSLLKCPQESISCVVLDRKPHDLLAGIDQQFDLCGKVLVDSLSLQIFHNERGIPEFPIVSMMAGLWVDHPSLALASSPSHLISPRLKRTQKRKV